LPQQSLSVLLRNLTSKDKDKRKAAADQLGKLADPRAVEPLIQASGKGGGEGAKTAAVRALASIGKPSVKPLINTLLHDRESVFRPASAAEALGLIGGEEVVKPLLQATTNPNVDVRLHTIVSLGRLREKRAIPYLVRALNDESGGVRGHAASALGILGNGTVVRPLVKALKDEKWYVRQQAARSLGLIGDKRAVQGLRLAIRDPRKAVAVEARKALVRITGAKQLVLVRVGHDQDPGDY